MKSLSLTKTSVTLLLVLIFSSGLIQARDTIPTFTIYTEDWVPFQYEEDGQLTGFAVELLNKILYLSGSSQNNSEMEIIPWVRAVNSLANENTIVFSMTKTEERIPKYQWVGPIYNITNTVIVKVDSKIEATDFNQTNDLSTALIKGDLGFEFLGDLNIDSGNIDEVGNGNSPLLMLHNARIDFVIDNWLNFKEIAARNSIPISEFKPILILDSNAISYAISKPTNTNVVNKLNTILKQFKETKEYSQLLTKYDLQPVTTD